MVLKHGLVTVLGGKLATAQLSQTVGNAKITVLAGNRYMYPAVTSENILKQKMEAGKAVSDFLDAEAYSDLKMVGFLFSHSATTI